MIASQETSEYLNSMDQRLRSAYAIAESARQKGYDPQRAVEIPIARDMAERVEGLISTVAPQIRNSGVSVRIHELEQQYGVLDWRVSLTIAEEISRQQFCSFPSAIEAMEVGIRVGFAYHTLGTVASPLEGLTSIKVMKRRDGKPYISLFYSGPIRSAGGTGASVSVLIADYVRKKRGYDDYDPTEDEIKRAITEVGNYHEFITNLQYLPSESELDFILRHLPVQIDGEPSETREVSNYKDLDRIQTNRIRNGICLVLGECLCQKAPKLWKQLSKWGKDFGLEHWGFLEKFVSLQKRIKAGQSHSEAKVTPDYTFIKDLVAGRPILTYPMRPGGFRLRYGRCRNTGYSSHAIHPATMAILDNYIAIGTQLKTERPGKATSLSSCDTIDGPIVLLTSGDVTRIDSLQQAKEARPLIKEILYLGDILVTYGDFYNRAHVLVPAGYCEEWWAQELKQTLKEKGIDPSHSSIAKAVNADLSFLVAKKAPSPEEALLLSTKLHIPLHPRWTYFWDQISSKDALSLLGWWGRAKLHYNEAGLEKAVGRTGAEKQIMEQLGLPHLLISNEFIVVAKDDAKILHTLFRNRESLKKYLESQTPLAALSASSAIPLRPKGGTFIGARMGRPEKSKQRELAGSPQVLFPVGAEGGRLRSFQEAIKSGSVKAEMPLFCCASCKAQGVLSVCIDCNTPCQRMYPCPVCGLLPLPRCPKHGELPLFREQSIRIGELFSKLQKRLGLAALPDIIKGVRGTSNKDHTAEHPAKGILRAKHNLHVNKDGTTRYDMTQLGLSHFRPKEIGTSVDQLKSLGYTKDIHGAPLDSPDQVVELKVQDVVLPSCEGSPDQGAHRVLLRVANFIDDELSLLYNLEPFYHASTEKDLIGHLILGLAPHTSAAIVGRIIGFSKTQGYYAHPLFHAAQRRDLDGDESCVILAMDAMLNFSRKYLPSHRGAVQDAPLVMTSILIPSEVDDMVFDLDVAWEYPLRLYEAAQNYEAPWNVQIEKIGDRINSPGQYELMGFTHDTSNINKGVTCSAYKTLPSMEEKLKGQMDIAERIRAVDASDVAKMVIEKHFLKDIKGNLRKFSQQQFRCVKCNEKYRRPPLVGKCRCGGRLIFTVSEGSIIKYLEPSLSLAEKYHVPAYVRQSLELTRRHVASVFGKVKETQEGLGKWFG